ncbi:hypothetical protein L1887_47944 [Cichorium endivia]|nr:hypothetical protein L1887_47944 [Cichorium endivia]
MQARTNLWLLKSTQTTQQLGKRVGIRVTSWYRGPGDFPRSVSRSYQSYSSLGVPDIEEGGGLKTPSQLLDLASIDDLWETVGSTCHDLTGACNDQTGEGWLRLIEESALWTSFQPNLLHALVFLLLTFELLARCDQSAHICLSVRMLLQMDTNGDLNWTHHFAGSDIR